MRKVHSWSSREQGCADAADQTRESASGAAACPQESCCGNHNGQHEYPDAEGSEDSESQPRTDNKPGYEPGPRGPNITSRHEHMMP
jgi:hypothetical protein